MTHLSRAPWDFQWHWASSSKIQILISTHWLLQMWVLPFVAGLVAARIAPRRALLSVACLYTPLALFIGQADALMQWKMNLLVIVFSICSGAAIGARRALPLRLNRA